MSHNKLFIDRYVNGSTTSFDGSHNASRAQAVYNKIKISAAKIVHIFLNFISLIAFYLLMAPILLILAIYDTFTFSSNHDIKYFPQKQAEIKFDTDFKNGYVWTPHDVRLIYDQPNVDFFEVTHPSFFIARWIRSLYANFIKGLSLGEYDDTHTYTHKISHMEKNIGNLYRRLSLSAEDLEETIIWRCIIMSKSKGD